MSRLGLFLLLASTAVLGASPPPAALFPHAADPLDDPFPIRRYRVPEARLADALKSLDAGPMVRMSRAEFEARVQKTASSVTRPVPRLTDATYTAVLVGNDLTGTAEFTVVNSCSRPVALPFDSFKLALRSATWADGREAVVGNLGGGPAVWVEKSGPDALRVKWSVLGTPEGGGQRYELRVPPTPAALLTLDLPADQTPAVANDDAMLTGPFPLDAARHEWRLRFGGRSRLEFTVRGPRPPDAGFAETTLAAQYDVTPEQIGCAFEYDLEPARGPVGEWVFALDAGLQVTDVVVNNRAGWRVEPGKTPADARKLRVTLRQPGTGGKLVISAVAAHTDSPLPVARPLNAVVQNERVEIRLHPDLQPRAWSPGDYRLTNSLVGADQARTLLLVGTLLPAGDAVFRRMPSLRVTDAAEQFSTTESVVWRPGRESSVVSGRVGVRVARGPLFRVAFRAPPGFALERTEPSDLVRHAGPTPSGFVVEFARPVTTGQRVELRFDLRGPGVAGGKVPFPQVSPVGAAQRDGWFSVCPDATWSASVQTEPPVPEADEFEFLDTPDDALATFTCRGTTPTGWLTLGSPPHVAPPPRPVSTSPNNAAKDEPVSIWDDWGDGLTDLYHITTVGERGDAVVVFGGTANDGGECVVQLPAGALVRAACVGGRWLDPAQCRTSGEGRLRLPLPTGDKPVRFEVRYRLPVPASREVHSPLPGWLGGADVRRWWVFEAGAVPSWMLRSHRPVPASDLPTLLGGPLDRASDAVIERFDGDTVTVESRRTATARGIVFALVVFLIARRRCGLSLVFAGCAGLVVAFGPPSWVCSAWPPLCVALVTSFVSFAMRVKPTVVALGVLVLGGVAFAQAPAPVVVFLVGESVVVPRAVLDRLDGMAKPFAPNVVITSASYDGRVADGAAVFVARYVVHSLQDGEAIVSLPLSDIRLESVTVNGAAAHPVAVRPDLYAVAVPGRGRHEIVARFAVAVTASGPERDVRFGVPDVPANRVSFLTPPGGRQAQAVGRAGAHTTGVNYSADLGAARSVHLRWRQGGAGAAVVKVREGSVWDVAEGTHSLTACYQVRIEQGTVTSLRFDLPAELEPTRVAVRPLDTDAATALLRGWTLGAERNGVRSLRLNLSGPTDGRLLVVLECSPQKSASRQPLLRFPRFHPNGATADVDSFYGLRPTRVGIGDVPRTGVIDFAADAFVRDRELSAIPDLRLEPGALAKAFQPVAGAVPELRPALRVAEDGITASLDTTWRVGATRADGEGVVRWSAKDPHPLIEFALPAVRVLEVRGPDVAAWGQHAGRVQVWLKKPARSADIEWVGTLTPSKSEDAIAIEPPTPRLPDGKVTADVVRVRVPRAWAVRVDRDRGWVASPEWTFTSDGTAPPVRVQVTPR